MTNYTIRISLITLACLLTVHLIAQTEYCATIDKYDLNSKIESTHIAIVEVKETILINIKWMDKSVSDHSFFGHAVFYNQTATFNGPTKKQYRITLIEPAKDCFSDLQLYSCNAIIDTGVSCNEATTSSSSKCWRH